MHKDQDPAETWCCALTEHVQLYTIHRARRLLMVCFSDAFVVGKPLVWVCKWIRYGIFGEAPYVGKKAFQNEIRQSYSYYSNSYIAIE